MCSKFVNSPLTVALLQAEAFVPPTSGANIAGDYKPGVLGTEGPIKISLANYNMSYNGLLVEITRDKNYPDIRYNQDINDGTPLGLGKIRSDCDCQFFVPQQYVS